MHNLRSLTVIAVCRKKREKLEYTKGVIRSRKSKDRLYNGKKKKDKQLSTKQYTDN